MKKSEKLLVGGLVFVVVGSWDALHESGVGERERRVDLLEDGREATLCLFARRQLCIHAQAWEAVALCHIVACMETRRRGGRSHRAHKHSPQVSAGKHQRGHNNMQNMPPPSLARRPLSTQQYTCKHAWSTLCPHCLHMHTHLLSRLGTPTPQTSTFTRAL